MKNFLYLALLLPLIGAAQVTDLECRRSGIDYSCADASGAEYDLDFTRSGGWFSRDYGLTITVRGADPVPDPDPIPDPVPDTISITATPSQVSSGDSALFQWSSTVGSCSLSAAGQSQSVPSVGSQSAPIPQTLTATLTCGALSDSATVTVVSDPIPDPDPDPDPIPDPDPVPDPTPVPSSYRGIPDPSAALGFDVRADYAVDQAIGNGSVNCNGTAADPCFVDARGANLAGMNISGSYVIVEGGRVNAARASGPFVNTSGCNNCVIRNLEVAGPGTDQSHSTAIWLGSNNVWIGGSVHDFGDARQNAREQDFHGFKVQATNVWILELEAYNLSGDGVQCGDARRGRCDNVYIGGGRYHDNRENAIDIKDSNNVVVSGVTMYGFRPTSSSPGEAVIVHDDAIGAKIYDNNISDSTLGIVSSGLRNHVIDGNTISALSQGIQLRNTQNITVQNNNITAPNRINNQGGVTGSIQQ